ncbi:MAG: hypothetical protein HY996_04715 [Micrococcales bacterium]|nr:hypothetical protein [Micrococcales bacterium]
MTDSPSPAEHPAEHPRRPEVPGDDAGVDRDPAAPLGEARHGTSAHGTPDRKVTIESEGEELVEEELIVEHAPGGGRPMPSAADLAAAQHPEDD